MAFDEDDLRAALRAGESAGPSAGHIVAVAEARRQARRDRVRTLAAAVVVIGAIGTGLGVLATHGGGNESATSAADGGKAAQPNAAKAQGGAMGPEAAGSAAGGSAAGGSAAGGSAGGEHGSSIASCPRLPARIRIPTVIAASMMRPLFASPVAAITACGYAAKTTGGTVTLTGSRVLSGARAQQLATSLDSASAGAHTDFCVPARTRVLVLYATSAAGGRLPPVRVELAGGCGVTATDGSAVRYDWPPPADLTALTE